MNQRQGGGIVTGIVAIMSKKWVLPVGVFAVKGMMLFYAVLFLASFAMSIIPSFAMDGEEALYAETMKKYVTVQSQLVNEKGVNFQMSYVMALDMLEYSNDFSKVTAPHIKKKAELMLSEEEKTTTAQNEAGEEITTTTRVYTMKSDEAIGELLKTTYPDIFDSETVVGFYFEQVDLLQEFIFANGGNTGGGELGDVVKNGKFIVPMSATDSPRVTAGWGLYDPYDNGNLKFHQATDWAGSANAKVLASAEGKIIKVVNSCVEGDTACGNGFGNQVLIQHTIDGKQYETLYAHFKQVNVQVGQIVKQAEVIGIQGNTGASNGAHVHFELHTPQFNYRVSAGQPAPTAIDPLTVIGLEKEERSD
ncbi:MAG: M23 family metallopeptidase [Culicoidibacterales bacterium]